MATHLSYATCLRFALRWRSSLLARRFWRSSRIAGTKATSTTARAHRRLWRAATLSRVSNPSIGLRFRLSLPCFYCLKSPSLSLSELLSSIDEASFFVAVVPLPRPSRASAERFARGQTP